MFCFRDSLVPTSELRIYDAKEIVKLGAPSA